MSNLTPADITALWHLAKRLHRCDSVAAAEAARADALVAGGRSPEWQQAVAETVDAALHTLRERERLHALAIRDPLTGLFNRRFMEDELSRQIVEHQQRQGTMAVALLDLDRFRTVNERSGHLAGDQVLRSLAVLLQGFRRETDVPCRYGGEEFVLIMPAQTGATAMIRLELLRSQVAEMVIHCEARQLDPVTASIGLAEFPTHGTTATALLAAADAALYRAKQAGRNRVCQAAINISGC